jgi:hypothetical protein
MTVSHHAKNRFMLRTGSGLTEYILPTLLLGGVVLGFLATTDWDILGQNYLANSTHGEMQNKTLIVQNLGEIDATLNNDDAQQSNNANLGNDTQTQTACFQGISHCLTIPIIQPNPETAGSLGGDEIDQLALVLEQLPQILVDLTVDPAVVDRVTKLASMGHGLADKLKAIEAICPAGKMCTGAKDKEARQLLKDLKKGELGSFLKEWTELNKYLKTNPNALAAFPEAYKIIQSRVKSIQSILNGLANQNQYTYTSYQSTQVQNVEMNMPGKYAIGQCQVTYQGKLTYSNGKQYCSFSKSVTLQQSHYQGLKIGSPTIKKVHQNANEICGQGGNTGRCTVQT